MAFLRVYGHLERGCVSVCVSVLSEVSSAGRNSHPVRSKQRPLVILDPWGLGYWEAKQGGGDRKAGVSKITLLWPDMTAFWVNRVPSLHTSLFYELMVKGFKQE